MSALEQIAVIMAEWDIYDRDHLTRLATEVNDTTGWTYTTAGILQMSVRHEGVYLTAPELAEAITVACQLLNI